MFMSSYRKLYYGIVSPTLHMLTSEKLFSSSLHLINLPRDDTFILQCMPHTPHDISEHKEINELIHLRRN